VRTGELPSPFVRCWRRPPKRLGGVSNSTSSTEATGLTEFTNSAKPPLGIRRTSVDSRRQTQSRAGSVAVDDGELLEIGYLGKAHGLQGELKLTLHNPDGEALD